MASGKKKSKEENVDKIEKKDEIKIFNYIDAILKKRELTDAEKKNFDKLYDVWMMDIFLSQNREILKFVQVLNLNTSISKEAHFKFFHSFIRDALKKKVNFIPFISQKFAKDEDAIKYVVQYFKCSERDAEHYLDIVDKEELDGIIEECKLYEKHQKGRK